MFVTPCWLSLLNLLFDIRYDGFDCLLSQNDVEIVTDFDH